MSVRDLERRVAALERPNSGGIDPLVLALDVLSENEGGLLNELHNLLSAGFSLSEIREMMGEESYREAFAIMERVDEELRRLGGS